MSDGREGLVITPSADEDAPPPGFDARGCAAGVLVASLALLVVAALLVLAGMAAVAAVRGMVESVQRDRDRQHADAQDDASAPACSRNSYDDLHAELTVTNDSSKPSRYLVEVEFLAPDGEQLDSSYGTAAKVGPGESKPIVIDTLTPAPEGPFTCRVANVDRAADGGGRRLTADTG